MIGLAVAMALAAPAVAGTVKEVDLLTAGTEWFYADPIRCNDDFALSVTDDVGGQEYTLEVGLLRKEGWVVESLDVTSWSGRPAQIGGTEVVLFATDCVPGTCGAQDEHPAPSGYEWSLYRSNALPSVDGDAIHEMTLHTVMQVGIEQEAVGSAVATYISTDSWRHGDEVISAYTEGTLKSLGGDAEGADVLDIVVSGGTTNTVTHGCSHASGLATFGWLPLAMLGLFRRQR
ncbi:MAG: hypothetical protein GWP91_26100 [Rhodobacterales bacterium]|nr:hypothetical protein [Rhodobacterales bacterium]